MQILLGAHETLIKLDQKREQIFNVENFIRKHFAFISSEDSCVILNYHNDEHHQRLFLLKWLYSLYKKSEYEHPQLRDHMLQRIEKPIRIRFTQPVSKPFLLSLTLKSKSELRLTVKPCSIIIYNTLKEHFAPLSTSFEYRDFSLIISCLDLQYQQKLLSLLESDILSNYNLTCDFTTDTIAEIYRSQEKEIPRKKPYILDSIDKAYIVLSANKDEKICTIKSKYRQLARQYHPDTLYGYDENIKLAYTEKFRIVQNAYELIRQQYREKSC
jgi:hypothetical protein